MFKKSAILIAITALFAAHVTQSVPYWNWQNKNVSDMSFPGNFKFGVTLLAYEVEGNSTNNSWYAHELARMPNGDLFSRATSGVACCSWGRYAEDIRLAAELGSTVYCFSIEWSKVETSPGNFDVQALQHYADVCDECNRNGIEPIVIFKDYRDPVWFLNAGGFENESNIDFFENYCLTVFKALQGKAYRFITFWAPESYAMLSYWNLSQPPFKKNMQTAINVLKNELEAHVRVYKTVKAADAEKKIQIGLTKHVVQLEPAFLWDRLACSMANILTNESVYNFFTTGKFDVSIRMLPAKWGGVIKHYVNADAPHSIDFVGINYHCHYKMKNMKKIRFKNEIETDCKGVTVYPEGLYYAIEEVSQKMARKLNIPIIVAQNGIATTSDNLRALHAERNIYAVSEAIKHGHNVVAYCYYSLLDGFMWGGYDKKFGLCAVNRTTMERTIKPGAHSFMAIAKKHRNMFS